MLNCEIKSAVPGLVWPAIPAAGKASNRLALCRLFDDSQWWPAARLQASQYRQLQKVVKFAVATIPFYRERLAGLINGHQPTTPEEWLALPILQRKELRNSGHLLKSTCIPPAHGQPFQIRTSGSTGMVVEVTGTALTNLFWQAFCLRDHFWHQRDFAAKLAAIRYVKPDGQPNRQGTTATAWGPATAGLIATGPAVLYSILLDIPYLIKCLEMEKPGYLLSHPSLVAGLARYCREHDIRLPFLREVRTLGESLPDGLHELCRAAWGIPLIDMYTCQEAGYLALQCPDHEHYHVQSENVLLEVLDQTGNPCGPGETGRVVITTLHNFATPLIRYELGDYAEVGPDCPCGRGLPVLRRILGRHRNLLTLPSGEQRWPRLGYESKLLDIAPIELMQMVQRTVNDIAVRLVMPRPLAPDEEARLSAFIQDNLGHPFHLSYEYVDTIRNPINGKLEQFISALNTVA